MSDPVWRVVVTGPAERDLREILRWTRSRFGAGQETSYAAALAEALRRLRAGPAPFGSHAAHPTRPALRKLPLGGRARHLLIYRIEGERVILVLRVLHDAMDLTRNLPP